MSEVTDVHRAELWNLICGRELGTGMSRRTFEHRLDGALVVKVEASSEAFQNVSEWLTWQRVEGTHLERWFAPCIAISQCGTVLIQRRTTPAAVHPEMIPTCFTDIKLGNFGILLPTKDELEDGPRFVCHDYGYTRLHVTGLTRRLTKATWLEDK